MHIEQSEGCGHAGIVLQIFVQAGNWRRDEYAHRAVEKFARHFGESRHLCRAAGKDDAAIEHFPQSGTLQFFANAGEDFLVTGGDLFDQVIAGDVAVGQVAGAGQGDAGVVVVFAVERAVAAFEHFRGLARHAQAGGEGARYLFAAHGEGGGVYRLVVPPQHDVRRACAEVNGADAKVAFFRAAGGIAGGEPGVDDAFDFHARCARTGRGW